MGQPIALACLACVLLACEAPATPRLVMLGFDGLDPRRVSRLLDEGAMPHIAALAREGYFGPLGTTNPPQSPTAWRTFATGVPPAEHGQSGFVIRAANGLRSELLLPSVDADDRMVWPDSWGRPPFWEVLARAGVPAAGAFVPFQVHPGPWAATWLGGAGVPDANGRAGSFVWLTGAPERHEDLPGGWQRSLVPRGTGVWQAEVPGRLAAPLTLLVELEGTWVTLGAHTVPLSLDEWSPYLPLDRGDERAFVRLRLLAQYPWPQVLVSAPSPDPRASRVPLSAPSSWAALVWREHGPFSTQGWPLETNAVKAGALSVSDLAHDARARLAFEAEVVLRRLRARADRLLVAGFVAPDRLGHFVAGHPGPNALLDALYGDVDRLIGAVRRALAPGDALVVFSDHGMADFRTEVDLNRWLEERGVAAARARVLGPDGVFFAGRAAQVSAGLTALQHAGTSVVRGLWPGRELFGTWPRRPHLRVALGAGYRMAWATTAGRAGDTVFAANLSPWCADHVSAHPEDVPGVLVTNRPVRVSNPTLLDLAPTAWAWFGRPSSLPGRPLFRGPPAPCPLRADVASRCTSRAHGHGSSYARRRASPRSMSLLEPDR